MPQPEFTRQLLLWNLEDGRRPMPWRGEKDPYKIWLSEIILQQTRVEQGWSYYEKFVAAYPTIQELAHAPDQTIFKMWEGLGYYTRCRNMLATARFVTEKCNGKFPGGYSDILKLKGVGEYTAAAIASFAFSEPQAVVDGNVQRVLARYFGITTPIDTTKGKQLYRELAQALLDEDDPGKYNQAIMDFGALVCRPKQPLCTQCPLRLQCAGNRLNVIAQLPVKEKLMQKKHRWFYYFIIHFGESIYIAARSGKDIWQNLYEFVLMETDAPLRALPASFPFLKEVLQGIPYEIIGTSTEFRQQLTHQHIHAHFTTLTVQSPLRSSERYLLVNRNALQEYPFPRIINSFLESAATSLSLF